jgi:outer membrane receptor protein involved in Fe transport
VDREYLSTVREDRVISESLGPYASNTFSWLPKLRTIAGLRYDSYRFRVDSDNPANSGTTSDSIASPKITLALGPWDQTEYFVNYGRGFHSNDARGTTTTVDPATGANVDRVSPLVRTEGYELGMRSQAIPGVTTSFALWELKQDSELLFVGDAGTTEPSRPSRRRGVEWLSEYVSRKGVAADISLALTQARFADSDPAGSSIPGAPDKVASAGVTAGGKVGWSGSIRWRYFGPRPLIEDNSVRSQSTSLVNAKVGYGFEKRMAANFEVLNLFNSKQDDISYYYQSQLRGEAAPVADIHFHPVERRAWRMTFTVNF